MRYPCPKTLRDFCSVNADRNRSKKGRTVCKSLPVKSCFAGEAVQGISASPHPNPSSPHCHTISPTHRGKDWRQTHIWLCPHYLENPWWCSLPHPIPIQTPLMWATKSDKELAYGYGCLSSRGGRQRQAHEGNEGCNRIPQQISGCHIKGKGTLNQK